MLFLKDFKFYFISANHLATHPHFGNQWAKAALAFKQYFDWFPVKTQCTILVFCTHKISYIQDIRLLCMQKVYFSQAVFTDLFESVFTSPLPR